MRKAYKFIANPAGGHGLVTDSGLVTIEELRDAPGVYAADIVTNPMLNKNITAFALMLDPRYDSENEALDELRAFLDSKIATLDPDIWNKE